MTRKSTLNSACLAVTGLALLSLSGVKEIGVFSFAPSGISVCGPHSTAAQCPPSSLRALESDDDDSEERPAGSFFHPIPTPADESSSDVIDVETDDEEESTVVSETQPIAEATSSATEDVFEDEISKLLQQRRKKPLASRPSTINGVPTEKATGFGKPKASGGSKKKSKTKNKPISPYVAIGTPDQPINDPSKPERDDQGYTLYTDTQTGEKSRVFEALVDYPSIFTMKIVGANEGTFVPEIVALVAEACETEVSNVNHTTKVMGKWVSVTVKAPVQSAEMLYSLYEKVDLDPRVKFKF